MKKIYCDISATTPTDHEVIELMADIQKEVFDIHPDPISLFPFKMNGHYTVEGYNLISKIIYKRIYDDGLLSY